MTKLYKYMLNEEESTNIKNMNFIERVKKDCGPWLKKSKGNYIFRGMNKTDNILYNNKVRTDRKPKNMRIDYQIEFDKMFKEKFGWKPRSEGLFATGRSSITLAYGKAYVIFPIGDFKYIWSPDVFDLLFEFSNKTEGIDKVLIEKLVNTYTDKNLSKYFRNTYKSNEIIIKCKEYHAIDVDFFSREET